MDNEQINTIVNSILYESKFHNKLILECYIDSVDNYSQFDRENQTAVNERRIFTENVFPALLMHPDCDLKNLQEQSFLMHCYSSNDNNYIPSFSFMMLDKTISKTIINQILDQFMWNSLIPVPMNCFRKNLHHKNLYDNEKISWIQFFLLEHTMINLLQSLHYDCYDSMKLINSKGESVWHVFVRAITEQYSRNNKSNFDYLYNSNTSILLKDNQGNTALELLNYFIEHDDQSRHSRNWLIMQNKIFTFLVEQFKTMTLFEQLNNTLTESKKNNVNVKL